jgi:hypothetical protein
MDLKEGWEKKALIGVGVVVLLIIIYAYFVPFTGTPDKVVPTQTAPVQTVGVPFSQPTANNSTSNTNSTNNGTLLNAEQSKAINIALANNPGYSAGTPIQNGTNVWIVPITKANSRSYNVYVDVASGKIILTTPV